MVTIRRVETPGRTEPMVTISMAKNESAKNVKDNNNQDKLLYTLVNGQAMRTNEAPSDLLPEAKLMDSKLYTYFKTYYITHSSELIKT